MGGTGGFIRRCERLQGGEREGQARASATAGPFDCATDDETVRWDDDLYVMASLEMTIYLGTIWRV